MKELLSYKKKIKFFGYIYKYSRALKKKESPFNINLLFVFSILSQLGVP